VTWAEHDAKLRLAVAVEASARREASLAGTT
jgi:hypothetical protein